VDQELPDAAAYTPGRRFVVHSPDGSTFYCSNLKVWRQVKKWTPSFSSRPKV